MGSRIGRLVALGVLVALALLATPGVAVAHATLTGSRPAAGAVLHSQPAEVVLTFDEPVRPDVGAVRVLTPGGSRADTGAVTPNGGWSATVTVSLRGGLSRGTYAVVWRVVSDDSHPVTGAFTFSVGAPSGEFAAPAVRTGSWWVGALLTVLRLLGYAALAGLLGGAVFVAVCWPAGRGAPALRRLVWWGWGLSLVATVAELLAQGPFDAGRDLAALTEPTLLRATLTSRLGIALVARLGLLGLAGWYLGWLFLQRRATVASKGCGIGLALALAGTWAATGHSSVGGAVPLTVPADAAHLLAMAVWIGGLTALGTVVLRRIGAPDAVLAVARFSPIAFGAVVVLAVTGGLQAWLQLGGPTAVLGTGYGRLLVAKGVGFVALVALGAKARRVLAARRSAATTVARLRIGVLAEVGVGVAVLAVTAVLVNTAPPTAVGPSPPPHTHVHGGNLVR